MNGAKEGDRRADGPMFTHVSDSLNQLEAAEGTPTLHRTQWKEIPWSRRCLGFLVQHRSGIQCYN